MDLAGLDYLAFTKNLFPNPRVSSRDVDPNPVGSGSLWPHPDPGSMKSAKNAPERPP